MRSFSIAVFCFAIGLSSVGAQAAPPEPTDKPAKPVVSEVKPAPESKAPPSEIVLDDFLVIPKLGVYGRVPMHRDPLEALLATGKWKSPEDGDSIDASVGSSRRWRKGEIDNGALQTDSAIGGYAVTNFDSTVDRIMLLEGAGYANVYVGGQLHAGDTYAAGWLPVPVEIVKGANELLFQISQPTMKAKLVAAENPVAINVAHATLPDIVRGVDREVWVGFAIINADKSAIESATLRVTAGDEITETTIDYIDAASLQQVAVPVKLPAGELADELAIELELVAKDGKRLASTKLSLPVVAANDLQRRTFRSAIDGSVQTYTLIPASDSTASEAGRLVVASETAKPGIKLALHDLGVTAHDFAQQLTASSDWHTVVPTGRSAFGFDWEDWSQQDIDEALDAATAVVDADREKLVAVGHGMGSHGVLQWGSTHPGRLAAAALVNGWPSLWTYGGGRPGSDGATPVEQMLLRPTLASDTLALVENLRSTALLILHSTDDAIVPVDQSRQLLAALAPAHKDFAFEELSGDEHGWSAINDAKQKPGEFFRVEVAESSTSTPFVNFATADLTQSSSYRWVTILQQQQPRELSSVELVVKENPAAISGKTTNVSRVQLDVSMLPEGKPFYVQLDRSRPALFREIPDDKKIELALQKDGRWIPAAKAAGQKSPQRGSGLKAVFANQPLLVYGTGGTSEQQTWAKRKAHYDAETFLYRGNGRLEVIPDTEFGDADFANGDNKDRNVVLYGNADTNSAWPALLSTSDVQVRGDGLVVNARPEQGDDLGVIMVRPRPDSEVAHVAVIGGTGLTGMRLTNRLRYFTAGIDYPDLLVFGPATLIDGTADVRIAGYFDGEWKFDDTTTAWRDLAL